MDTTVSFVIPAYDEQALIGETIRTLQSSARGVLGERSFEIVVVDDASADRTASIAEGLGARVVRVNLRQIAAARNSGARAARGEVLIFVDADTLVPQATLAAALAALEEGAVGGGSRVSFEGRLGLAGRLYFELFLALWRPLRLAAGCFVFVRRADFFAVGGFDERYYASEEIWLSRALKRRGRFVILRGSVITSGRKTRLYGAHELFALALRLLLQGPRAWRRRQGLELWYDGRREPPRRGQHER